MKRGEERRGEDGRVQNLKEGGVVEMI